MANISKVIKEEIIQAKQQEISNLVDNLNENINELEKIKLEIQDYISDLKMVLNTSGGNSMINELESINFSTDNLANSIEAAQNIKITSIPYTEEVSVEYYSSSSTKY